VLITEKYGIDLKNVTSTVIIFYLPDTRFDYYVKLYQLLIYEAIAEKLQITKTKIQTIIKTQDIISVR